MRTRNVELESALREVEQLSDLMPICASCKRVRDDDGYWQEVTQYLDQHSQVRFTHSLCPECIVWLYPDLAEELEESDA